MTRRARLTARVPIVLTATLLAVPPASALRPTDEAQTAQARSLPVTGFALRSSRPVVIRRSADTLSTVSVAAVGISGNGRRVNNRPDDTMLRLVRQAHRSGLHAELLVSNYSNRREDFDPERNRRLLNSPANIERVAGQLADLVADGGWDAVNVDLELVARRDAAGLVAFVQAIQDAMPAEKTVSVDVSGSTTLRAYRARGYDLAGLAGAADTIALMTYDQHGPSWSGPGPIGGLPWQERAARAALRKVPANQLDLGVAGYGYFWPKKGVGHTLSINGVRRRVKRAGVRPVWKAEQGEWTARLPNGTVLWWSDGRSYRKRVKLARRLGVHGLALWRLGSSDPLD